MTTTPTIQCPEPLLFFLRTTIGVTALHTAGVQAASLGLLRKGLLFEHCGQKSVFCAAAKFRTQSRNHHEEMRRMYRSHHDNVYDNQLTEYGQRYMWYRRY